MVFSTSKQFFRTPEESSPFSLTKISQLLLSGQNQCSEQTAGIAMISTQGKRNADYVTEKQKALITNCHESAIADHVFLTNHRIKWDHFEISQTGRSDMHCKIKESLLIRDLKPTLNENVGSEKLYLYYQHILVVLCQSVADLHVAVI